MKTLMVTCDVCGKVKGEKNGWWEMHTIPEWPIQVYPFGECRHDGINHRWIDLCGVHCVQEAVRRVLEKQSPSAQRIEVEPPMFVEPILRVPPPRPIDDDDVPF